MTSRLLPHKTHTSCSFAYQRWGKGNAKKIICFHGWLDNSMSFSFLGPRLAEIGYDVVAADHQGHGRSSHAASAPLSAGAAVAGTIMPSSGSYPFTSGIQSIKFVLDALARDQESEERDAAAAAGAGADSKLPLPPTLTSLHAPSPLPALSSVSEEALLASGSQWRCPHAIIGHSMSAAMTMLFAATFPEYTNRLVLIEGFGPLTSSPSKCSKQLRAAILAEDKYRHEMQTPAKIYPSLTSAIQARVDITKIYPGKQSISREAAAALMSRGVRLAHAGDTCKVLPLSNYPVEDLVPDLVEGLTDVDAAGNALPVRFRYDHRLALPSQIYMTTDQVDAFTADIMAHSLLIEAENGWPPQSVEEFKQRLAIMVGKGILHHVKVPGSHHCHMDPSDRGLVFDHIVNFLANSPPANHSAFVAASASASASGGRGGSGVGTAANKSNEGLLEGTVARAKADAKLAVERANATLKEAAGKTP